MGRVFQVFALIFNFFYFYCVLGLFSAVVCSLHFHIVVVSSCCPVGFVCFRLLSFLVSGAFLSFVVFVVLGCSSMFMRLFQG